MCAVLTIPRRNLDRLTPSCGHPHQAEEIAYVYEYEVNYVVWPAQNIRGI